MAYLCNDQHNRIESIISIRRLLRTAERKVCPSYEYATNIMMMAAQQVFIKVISNLQRRLGIMIYISINNVGNTHKKLKI